MLHNIPDEITFKQKNIALLLFIMKGYKTEYKWKDPKNGLWIMEGYDFWIKHTSYSRRNIRYIFDEMEKLDLIKVVSTYHPKRHKKTLAIKLKKRVRKIMKIYEKDRPRFCKNKLWYNPAKIAQSSEGQLGKNCTIKCAKTAQSSYIIKSSIKSLVADAPSSESGNIIQFSDFRKDKNMKIQKVPSEKKGMNLLKTKSPKSFDEVISSHKKSKEPTKLKIKKVKDVEIFWKKMMAKYFPDTYTVTWSGKEQGYVKSLISKVSETGLDFEKLVRQTFQHWELFGGYVIEQRGFKTFPDYPSIGFLAANPQQFVNFKPEKVQVIAPEQKHVTKRRTVKEFLGEV